MRHRDVNLLEVIQLVSDGDKTKTQQSNIRLHAVHHYPVLPLVYYGFMCFVLDWSLKLSMASTPIKNRHLKKKYNLVNIHFSIFIYFEKLPQWILLASLHFVSKSGRVHFPRLLQLDFLSVCAACNVMLTLPPWEVRLVLLLFWVWVDLCL